MADAIATVVPGQSLEKQQYITFYLNNEEYAVDALNVQGIIELSNITKVPHLPEFIKGVINLRGTIIPVIDLKLKFGMTCEEYKKHTCIIITDFSGGIMGIIADAVSDVLHMPDESVASTPSFGAKIRTDFIKGMGQVDNRLVIILDIEKILTQDETSLVSDITGEEPAGNRIVIDDKNQ